MRRSTKIILIKDPPFNNSSLYCVLTAIQNNIGTFAAQKLDGFLRIQTLWRSKVLVLSRFFFRFEFQSWLSNQIPTFIKKYM